MGSRTLANDAKQIIALYSLSGVLALRTVAAQAPVVVVYGPGLHLRCLCEITGCPAKLFKESQAQRQGWVGGAAVGGREVYLHCCAQIF